MARRPCPGLLSRAAWALACVGALAASTPPAEADPVQIRAANHDDFGRLMFFWPSPVTYETGGNRDRLIIRFQRPIVANYDPASESLGQYLGVVEPEADGHSVVIPLREGVSARSFALDNAVVVDLSRGSPATSRLDLQTAAAPESSAASKSATPPEPASVRVRTGEHPGFSRIVFDWPTRVAYTVFRSGTSTSIVFDHAARFNLRRLERRPLKYVQSGSAHSSGDTATVTLTVPEASKARHFRIGNRVVVDVLGSDAEAANIPLPADAEVVEPGSESAGPRPELKPAESKRTESKPEASKPAEPSPGTTTEITEPSGGDAAETTENSAGDPTRAAKPGDLPPGAPQSEQTVPADRMAPPKTGETAKPDAPATVAATETPESEATEAAAEILESEATKSADWRFDWDQPVGAAVFRRAGALWVVFDAPVNQEVTAPIGTDTLIRDLEAIPVQRATALRMSTPDDVNPRVARDGLTWVLRLAEHPLAAQNSIEARAEVDENGEIRLFLPVPEPGDPIGITDPEVGDNLIVVPVIPLGHGVSRAYTYPQLRLLATAQGVVIQPFIDNLRVRSLADGIEITTATDLSVSPVSKEIQAGARVGSPEGLTRLLALERWIGPPAIDFGTRRHALESAVIDAAPMEKEKARMEFARFFLAHTYAAEAFGALTLTAQHRPEIENQPEFRAMRGVSRLLLGRVGEAREDLFHDSLDGNDEASLWRAAVEATEGQFSRAAVDFSDSVAITRTYPKALRTKLNLLLAEAAIAADQAGPANTLMEVLEAEVSTASEKIRLEYLRGRYLEAIGDYAGALEIWANVTAGPDRHSGAKASMASAELSLKTGDITRQQAIEALEGLRFAWRGGALEVRLLRRLAELYQEEEDYLGGLRTLREVAGHFPADRQAPEITKQMSETFERLFLNGHADNLPAVSTIALYREFQELTPTGDKGDEMIRKLADRLVEVDLLDDAAALLEKQVRYRLTGVDKAKVGARLALVHQLNRHPQAALDALHLSAASDLPEDLNRQRGRLAAEALSALGKPKHALSMLNGDDSLEADLIRSDVYWASEDWRNASQTLSRIVSKSDADPAKPLSERHARLVLNLAVALTLAGDEEGVSRLRKDFDAAMSASPLRDAFDLITGAQAGGDVAGRDWSNQVKQAENFQAYLGVYRAQLQHRTLSTIN